MPKLADPTIWDAPSGTEYALDWSKDGTVGTLMITRQGACEGIRKISLTIQQLDELREFLADNIE